MSVHLIRVDFAAGAWMRRTSNGRLAPRSAFGLIERLENRRLMSASPPFGLTDNGFGVDGHVIEPISGGIRRVPRASQVIAASNGLLYVGGNDGIARFTAAGTADLSYGGGGIAALGKTSFRAEALDAKARLFVLGATNAGTTLRRYTQGGALDTSFGQNGIALISSDASFNPSALSIQPDGEAVVAGTWITDVHHSRELEAMRVDGRGLLDRHFGLDGIVRAQLGDATEPFPRLRDAVVGIQLRADGEILIGGGSTAFGVSEAVLSSLPIHTTRGPSQFATVLLTAEGSLDATYGSGGICRQQYAEGDSSGGLYSIDELDALSPTAFVVRADGSALLGGSSIDRDKTAIGIFAPHGSFLSHYFLPRDRSRGNQIVGAVAAPDGRTVILSRAFSDVYSDFSLTPIAANGVPGPSVTTDDLNPLTPELTYLDDNPAAITFSTEGKLIVAGTPESGNGYELQQVSASQASVPPPDKFPHGTINSVQSDSSGGLHLAYYDSATRTLKYAHRLPNGLWRAPIIVDARSGAGEYLSIDVNAEGNPSIAYVEPRGRRIMLATSIDGGDSFSLRVIDTNATPGICPSLQFDEHNFPAIAYYTGPTGDLRFATEDSAGQWVRSTIARDAGGKGRSAALSVMYKGSRPTIGPLTLAYVDVAHDQVRWAIRTKRGRWRSKIVVAAPANDISLGYGIHGSILILYRDTSTGNLMRARYAADTGISADNLRFGFSVRTVVSHPGSGAGMMSAVIARGTTHELFTYDSRLNGINDYYDPDPSLAPVEVVANGGRYLSLSSALDGAYVDSVSGELTVGWL